ncbi:hypothetical protein MVEG_08440 [Podila verticillata NRRL 6337]|nr:hypothetical protein MVEG_08440 [Podila verticillata NRRL 6337]
MEHQTETNALSSATSGSPSLTSSGEPAPVLPESANTAIRTRSLCLRDASPNISNSDWSQIQDYQDTVYRLLSKAPCTVNAPCCLSSVDSSASLAPDAPLDQPHTVERGPGPPPQSTTSDAAQGTDAPPNQSHCALYSRGTLPTLSSLSSFSSPSSSSLPSSDSGRVDDYSAGHTSTRTAESSSEAHLRPRGGIQFSGMRQVQEYLIHHPPRSVLPAKKHRRTVPLEQEMFRQSVGRSQRSSYYRNMRRQRNKWRVEEPVDSEAVSRENYDDPEDREEDEELDEEQDEEQDKGEEDEEGAKEEGEMEGGQEEEEEKEQASKKEVIDDGEEEKAIKRGNEEGDLSDPSVNEERDQDILEGEIVGSGYTGTHSSALEPSLDQDGSSSQSGPHDDPRQLEMVQSLGQLKPNMPSSESDPEDPSSVLDPGESSGLPERGETSSQPPSENPGKRNQDSDEERPCCLKCPIHCPRIHPSRSSHALESQGSTGSGASTSAAGSSIPSQTTSPTSLKPVSQPLLHLTSRPVFDPSSIGLLMLPPSTSQTRPGSGWFSNNMSTPSTQSFQSTAQSTQPATQRATQVQQTTLRRSARLAGSAQPPRTRSASKRGRTGPAEQSSSKRKKK